MNIKINNTSTAISDAEMIISCANSFESLVSTMFTIKNNFESNWIGEESADRTSIINSLNNSITFYEDKIIPALKGLGNGINAYAIATDRLAQASVGDTTLRGMTPSEFADSNGPSFDQDRYNALGGGNSLYDGSYSKEEFLNMVTNFGNNNLGTNTIGNSPVNVKTGYETNMLPYAETFYDEAVSRGLDPAFVFAIGCQESGYGSSWNAVNKGNLFGMGAFDDSPSNAFSYDSVQAAIADVCDNIATNYVTPGGKFYTGSNISSIGQTYAGDPNWANSVTYIMNWIKDSKSL